MTEGPEQEIVTIQPYEFRLPAVLGHIEAGRIVHVVLPARRCGECGYLIDAPGHLAECQQDHP